VVKFQEHDDVPVLLILLQCSVSNSDFVFTIYGTVDRDISYMNWFMLQITCPSIYCSVGVGTL